jgi:hypothetical protein
VTYPVSGATALKSQRRAVEPEPRTGEVPRQGGVGLKVAPPAPVRATRMPFVVLVLLIVVAGVVGILVLNIRISENAFELDRLQQNQKSLDINQGQLQKEIAEREAPGALAGQASEYGLKPPSGPPRFIVLPDDRKLDMPQPVVGK